MRCKRLGRVERVLHFRFVRENQGLAGVLVEKLIVEDHVQ
jgi:hypothetical protein